MGCPTSISWSPHPDLNRGPLPYQGSALPLSYVGKLFTECTALTLERVMGIEPTSSAWKAEVLPLNYTRLVFIAPLYKVSQLTIRFASRRTSL